MRLMVPCHHFGNRKRKIQDGVQPSSEVAVVRLEAKPLVFWRISRGFPDVLPSRIPFAGKHGQNGQRTGIVEESGHECVLRWHKSGPLAGTTADLRYQQTVAPKRLVCARFDA